MSKLRGRINLDFGWADFDRLDTVRVGDRMVPKVIDVHFPGAGGQPALRMKVEVRQGVPVCAELALTATDEGREVRSVDLRAVRLEDWIEPIVGAASELIVAEADGVVTTTVVRVDAADRRAAVATVRQARRGGRRRITNDLLAQVATIYREHLNDRPVEAVQSAFGTSYRTAARYVQSARDAGVLDEWARAPKPSSKGPVT